MCGLLVPTVVAIPTPFDSTAARSVLNILGIERETNHSLRLYKNPSPIFGSNWSMLNKLGSKVLTPPAPIV